MRQLWENHIKQNSFILETFSFGARSVTKVVFINQKGQQNAVLQKNAKQLKSSTGSRLWQEKEIKYTMIYKCVFLVFHFIASISRSNTPNGCNTTLIEHFICLKSIINGFLNGPFLDIVPSCLDKYYVKKWDF